MDCSVSPLGFQGLQVGFYVNSVESKSSGDAVQAPRNEPWFPTSTPIQPRSNDSGYHSTPQKRDRLNSVKRRCSFVLEEDMLLSDDSLFVSLEKHQDYSDSVSSKYLSKFQDDYVSSIEVEDSYHSSLADNEIFYHRESSHSINKTEKDLSKSLIANQRSSYFQSYYDAFLSSFLSIDDLNNGSEPQQTKESLFFCTGAEDSEFSEGLSFKDLFRSFKTDADDKVDFIKEFNDRKCFPVLNKLFSYLSGKELAISSCVSQEWKDAILSNKQAHERKSSYLKKTRQASFGPDKENSKADAITNNSSHLGLFKEVQNIDPRKSVSLHIISDAENFSFLQVSAVSEAGTKLQKCPLCSSSSKVNNNGLKSVCMKKFCKYEFCAKCRGPYAVKHSCSLIMSSENNSHAICSKKSRRNLKRL